MWYLYLCIRLVIIVLYVIPLLGSVRAGASSRFKAETKLTGEEPLTFHENVNNFNIEGTV